MSEGGFAQRALNLDSWMRELPGQLRDVPLIYLAIPGSHDSMTFSINKHSKLAPDAEPAIEAFSKLFKGTIVRWSITQTLDATGQLLFGIRYFDLRLATKTDSESFFFTHSLYADEISRSLNEIRDFVDSHPGEAVILDFQHFYGFTSQDHQRLIRYLLNLYGPRLVPRTEDLPSVTLNSLERFKRSVIIVYRHESVHSTSELWRSAMLPSPWPQKDRVSDLLAYLQHVRRGPATGFVHQAVLTPTTNFLLLRWYSNLKDKCAKPVVKEVVPKLVEFDPGRPTGRGPPARAPVNVVIADFIELEDFLFPKTVIQLNWKLIRDAQFIYHSNGFEGASLEKELRYPIAEKA